MYKVSSAVVKELKKGCIRNSSYIKMKQLD